MRNRHEGVCYYCGKIVAAGDGHFEKIYGSRPAKWRVIHANCVFKQRAEKEKAAQSAATDERHTLN